MDGRGHARQRAAGSPIPSRISRNNQHDQSNQSPKTARMVKHKVMWRKNWKGQDVSAWWDSLDGQQGGRKLRVHVLDDQLRLVRKLDLFPPGPYLLTLVTRSGRTVELPYATFTYCSADAEGPPSFIFVAPGGIVYPRDAEFALPSLEKQLEFKQSESERVAALADRQRMDAMEAEVTKAEQAREQYDRTDEQSIRLGKMRERARNITRPEDAADDGEQPDGSHAIWTQLRPTGVLPPAQKHPITLLREFEKQISAPSLDFEEDSSSLAPEKPKRAGSKPKRNLSDSHISVRVLTLEVWTRDFTVRYNLFLKVENVLTGHLVDPKWCGIRLMTWIETHVFDPQVAPSPRDSPSLSPFGQKLILFGGKTRGSYKSFFGDLWAYNYNENRWSMFEDEGRGVRGQREKLGLSGKKPTPRSSALLQYMSTLQRAVQLRSHGAGTDGLLGMWRGSVRGHNLIIAGGTDRSGKRQDMRFLDLNTLEFHELVAEAENIKAGDVQVSGQPPARGFSMKKLHTANQIYAPLLSDQKIHELCLHTNTWSTLQTEGFLPWKSSRLLVGEDGPMTRFTALDCGSLDTGYPAVESAQAWRVFSNLNPDDIRQNPPREWQLQQGQVMKFNVLPSIGDVPGTWVAHSVSTGHLDRSPQTGRIRTIYYVFGGCREGGVASMPKIPTRRELIIGKDMPPSVGMRVRRRAKAHGTVGNLRAPTASSRRSGGPEAQDGAAGIVVRLGGREQDDWEDFVDPTNTDELQLTCMVLWDGEDEPRNCRTGFRNEYELRQAVNYEMYHTQEHITNEVFSFEVVEGVEHDNVLNELYEIRKDQGFTDASALKSVLGDAINIVWNEKRRRRRRQSVI